MPDYEIAWSHWMHPLLATRPTGAVFAKGGDWEKALQLSQSKLPKWTDLSVYLQDFDEVAFEVFCGPAFFGLRVGGGSKNAALFALRALDSFGRARSGIQFVEDMVRAGYVNAHARLKGLELGAVFAWNSVGAFRLPPVDSALATWNDWWPSLRDSDLLRDDTHAKALELAFDENVEHWYGVPVCDADTPAWLSADRLRLALTGVEAAVATTAPCRPREPRAQTR